MARIRTIKPEFPQSEAVGRLTRDARLLFIQLFTLADDSGRLRGNSRILASLLYPYDDDAILHIDGWLGELARESMIDLYEVSGARYLQIRNWLIHQKIDKPSPSKIPQFDEPSRVIAECSGSVRDFPAADHRIIGSLDHGIVGSVSGPGEGSEPLAPPKRKKRAPSVASEKTAAIWEAYCKAYYRRYGVDPIRNAKVNAQIQQLSQRLGDDAPHVAAYYVSHGAQWYVSKGHAAGQLLADAEKLHTEWRTGSQITNTTARLADRTSHTAGVFRQLIEEERAKQAQQEATT